MTSMGIDNPVPRHLSQPQVKRHLRIGQVFLDAAMRFNKDLLHNVTGIEPSFENRIHPQVDHASHGFAMAVEQPVDGLLLTGLGGGEHLLGCFRIGPHIRRLLLLCLSAAD